MVSQRRSTTFSKVAKPRFESCAFVSPSRSALSASFLVCMEGYGKVQYSQALPVFPICATQLHCSTSEWYHAEIVWIIPAETDSYTQYCDRAWQENRIPQSAARRTLGIPVFQNMVTWNAGSDAFFAPAVLGMVDAAEACLILEHKAHFSTAPVLRSQWPPRLPF